MGSLWVISLNSNCLYDTKGFFLMPFSTNIFGFNTTFGFLGVVNLMEDNFNLKNPTFFIVAEKDEFIPVDQVRYCSG